jgi:hypothetical protein
MRLISVSIVAISDRISVEGPVEADSGLALCGRVIAEVKGGTLTLGADRTIGMGRGVAVQRPISMSARAVAPILTALTSAGRDVALVAVAIGARGAAGFKTADADDGGDGETLSDRGPFGRHFSKITPHVGHAGDGSLR